MKSILKTVAIVLTLAFTAVSCSSDNDNNSGSASRDVRYELTGNYTGTLSATFMEKGGNVLNEDVTKLPWTKEFTAEAKALGASVSASGYGGNAGQQLTAKMYVGGKLQNESTATANSNGIIVVQLTAYVFPQ